MYLPMYLPCISPVSPHVSPMYLPGELYALRRIDAAATPESARLAEPWLTLVT